MHRWEKIYQSWKNELQELIENPQNSSEYYKKKGDLENKCKLIETFLNIDLSIEQARENSKNENDSAMKELWLEEITVLENQLTKAENVIAESLLSNKNESVILEIRAGEGGDEASIFALELMNMYIKLCKIKKWNWSSFSINYSPVGGLKEGVFELSGNSIAAWLNCESGVHCVKRVPKTEKKGRTHTSTATVAILIEPEEVAVVLNEKDLKIDVFRSSGPGGQSVNTTDSAVRVTHLPTGIVVSMQDEKSQHKNKEKALKILKARVYQKKIDETMAEAAANRKNAVGNARRNERIRTYHFSQNWINDTRLEKMCHNVTAFMEADALCEFLDQLIWNSLD